MCIVADDSERMKQMFVQKGQSRPGKKVLMKKFFLWFLAAFFAAGAGLWFWVAATQSEPQLAWAAFEVALLPAALAVLLIEQARRRSPGQQ